METSSSSRTNKSTGGALDTTVSIDALANDPSIQTYKNLFAALDAQKLEIVSLSEHDRMLSSSRHMEIADAMEEVLAQPSVRKEKSRARRLSRLGRIAGRRISLVPITQSALPSLIEDDLEWDDDEVGDDVAPLARDSNGVGRTSSMDQAKARDRVSAEKLSFGRRSSSLASLTRESLQARTSSSFQPRPSSGRLSSVELQHHAQLKLQQRKIVTENVLRLLLHSRVLPVASLRGALRNVSTSWRHISNMYARRS